MQGECKSNIGTCKKINLANDLVQRNEMIWYLQNIEELLYSQKENAYYNMH